MNVVDLRGLFLIDTNVLVYSFDATSPQKQQIAQEVIRYALQTQRGVISTQVVQEFLNLALRKFAKTMSTADARQYLLSVLGPLCQQFPSISFYDQALSLQLETGYSWYDSLVVAAAIEAGCTSLLSEDMQHNRKVRNVTIINPFL